MRSCAFPSWAIAYKRVILILCGNEIKKGGALALAESLTGKESFVKIDLDANLLGEQGCKEVQSIMEAAGLLDTLASLSGDEASEDEDDDSEGDYSEDDEEEGPEEDEDGEISTDPHLQVKGSALTPSKQKQNPDDLADQMDKLNIS